MEHGGTFQPASISREFDDGWTVGQSAGVVDDGAIDQSHIPSRFQAVAAVNVPEDMEPRLDPEYGTEQVLTSRVFGQNARCRVVGPP